MTTCTTAVYINVLPGANLARAKQLYSQLESAGIPILGAPPDNIETIKNTVELCCTESRIELRHFKAPELGAIAVDFESPSFTYRLKRGGGRQQALGKAVGLKHNKNPTVIDATAGMGKDAYILASLGCSIHLIERSPIIYSLLVDGLFRAENNPELLPITQRLTAHLGDSIEHISAISKKPPPDVIYLDPMFPHRSKSALVKKEMRVLQLLAGTDPDSGDLLRVAVKYAKNRVVCKRPSQAAPLSSSIKPSHSIKTKKHRFDVYVTGC